MKATIIKILNRNFTSLAFYFKFLGISMIWMLIMSLFVGLLDGFGLAMFVPLLQIVSGEENINPDAIGNLKFLIIGLEAMGLSLSLIVILSVIGFFFTLKGFAKWLEQYLRVVYNQRLIKRARFQLLQNIINISYLYFAQHSSGRLQNAMTGEVGRLAQSFYSYSQMFQNLVLLITYVMLAFIANPQFAMMAIIGGGATNLLFRLFYSKTKKHSANLVIESNSLQASIIQLTSNYKYLKATNRLSDYSKKVEEQIINVEKTNREIGELDSISTGIREPIMIYILIIALFIQTYILKDNIGSVIVSLLLLYRGLSSIVLLQAGYNRFLSFHGSISNYLDLNNELQKGKISNSGQPIEKINHQIDLINISFAFDKQNILEDINLSIKKNELIGIVGESGSGKTTLINIISRILTPTSGTMLIDRTDSANIDINSYQNRIGYITQEPIVFEDTIFNNITFWDIPSEENLIKFYGAIEKAQLAHFVNDSPLKENLLIGINGINLSGGQKQRIAIARELYRDIDFLLLDEATSALDVETEELVQKSIDELKGQLTVIIIAHRTSTLKKVDRIFEMKSGTLSITSPQELGII